jgi:hypothetical protein
MAMLSRQRWRFVRMGLSPDAARETLGVLLDSGSARAALMTPVLQGSALWCAPEGGFTKIQAEGGAEPRRCFRVSAGGSFARDCRPMRHARNVERGVGFR